MVGAIIVPTLAAGFLALLPWIDRGPERDPRRRRLVMALVMTGVVAVIALTTLGWRDRPVSAAAAATWTMREIGGRAFVTRANCARCHDGGGMPATSSIRT